MKKNIFAYLVLCTAVIISGCANDGDEDYALAEEQYAMGWILHNINDSTPTELNYSIGDVATYNYFFNYPAGNSSVFYNTLFWIAPVHINATDMVFEPLNEFVVPLNRTYYVMGNNPAPENYQTNWSFANQMMISYGSYMDTEFEEYDFSSDVYNAAMPVAGDTRTVYFGTAPFLPAQIHVTGENITFTDRLVRGYKNTSYLVRWTTEFAESLVPKYEIYHNGTLNSSGSFESSWGYYDTTVNYSIIANGTYIVNITIPTGYPAWNMTQLLATINIPSEDVEPPALAHIDAAPYFEHNKNYSVGFNITDNATIGNVSAYYRESGDWIGLSLENVSQTYSATINITNSSTEKIDLKIVANDTSQNSAEYTIMPVALTKITPVIALTPVSVIEGGQVTASGNITDSYGTGIRRLRLYFFVDGNYTGISKTGYSGGYSIPFNVSCGTSDINFSVAFNGSGIYEAKEQQFQIERVVLDFSASDNSYTHQSLPINFTAAGATITINRTDINWSYSALITSDKFAFTPRNYGNYTITMNSTCVNTTKDVFVNTQDAANISSPQISLTYPLENTTFTATINIESQSRYAFSANISNSSSSDALNTNWTGQSFLDPATSEPYNQSSNTWTATINKPAGQYNITALLENDAGENASKTTPIYVFPAVNATFDITNNLGQANSRLVSIKIGSENNTYASYEISGMSTITIPNNTYFYPGLTLPLHIEAKKEISATENASVTLLNSTIGTTMDLVAKYYVNNAEFQDKIIHGIYAYQPSWNYNSTRMYLRLSTTPMRHPGSATIYACENWNFGTVTCDSGWAEADILYTNFQGSLVEIEALSNNTKAFALAEPSYCADDYCSVFESCSSCPVDCGACSTSPANDTTVISSGGGGSSPINSVTISPNEIITKISVTLKTKILGPSLAVSKLSSSSVGSAASMVYHYFEISTVNITTSNIKNTAIEFKVNNSWITGNNIDPDSIALNRYTTKWNVLPTSKKSNDSTYTYYSAETPGFSIFAITGSAYEAQQTSPAQTPPEVECPVCPECTIWSGCIDSQDIRTCYKCDEETGYVCQKYSDIKNCDTEEPSTPGKKSSAWIYVLLAIFVIAVAVLALSIVPDDTKTIT